ncbi:hypothetical protein CALCODRAFT_426964 [Calocera cornea HHB12733]|uniref:C2H2-type domain-containing protein n=1 Tax=Calocera cornea HHB12733 TaxID=1353952 RepID=A0A165JNF4_9BASI|nr:hypothetical protein CALCODRAFT_426964 [Calocera cornea HHB12733]
MSAARFFLLLCTVKITLLQSLSQIFTASGHLTRHLTIHTGVKAYTCPFPDCEKRCTRMDNLTQQ